MRQEEEETKVVDRSVPPHPGVYIVHYDQFLSVISRMKSLRHLAILPVSFPLLYSLSLLILNGFLNKNSCHIEACVESLLKLQIKRILKEFLLAVKDFF